MDKNLHKQLAEHLIFKKAYSHVSSLQGMSLLERVWLELEHFSDPVT